MNLLNRKPKTGSLTEQPNTQRLVVDKAEMSVESTIVNILSLLKQRTGANYCNADLFDLISEWGEIKVDYDYSRRGLVLNLDNLNGFMYRSFGRNLDETQVRHLQIWFNSEVARLEGERRNALLDLNDQNAEV